MAKARSQTTIVSFVQPSVKHDVCVLTFVYISDANYSLGVFTLLCAFTQASCVALLRCFVCLYRLCIQYCHSGCVTCVCACVCVRVAGMLFCPLATVSPLIDHCRADLWISALFFSFSLCLSSSYYAKYSIGSTSHTHTNTTHTDTRWINYMQHHRSSLSKCGVWCSDPT